MTDYPITRPSFSEEEVAEVRACLDSGWVTQGPRTLEFETAVARRHDVAHALATTSCTAGLHLATLALGLGSGDEVIVPAFTWITSANAAEYVGARAVFVDIDLETFNLDPEAVRAAITPRTKAIIAVHLFGLAAPMSELQDIAKQHNLAIIEDAACAIGTTYNGRPVGGIGDLGCFSFHPRKVITTGEGGMVTTNSELLAGRVGSFRNHGTTAGPSEAEPWGMNEFGELGFNLRLSDIQAAVGVVQMKKLDALLTERRKCAEQYNQLLAGTSGLCLPLGGDVSGHSYQSYVVRIDEGGRNRRNAIMSFLKAADIQTRPGTHAVHMLEYYSGKYNLQPGDFPRAAEAQDTTITLPIFPGMTESDQRYIAEKLQTAMEVS
ncbi:DegT/DnrJ/EryC1/StrS family aminotransferase [Pyruvatibacter sp.]|uniref:DegT/DnrJ/EryC1/StrS family aminotransferase n=1 Tax=Pyruvatibacter sp. TaxID=1981328 RepID=UPI0032ED3B5D